MKIKLADPEVVVPGLLPNSYVLLGNCLRSVSTPTKTTILGSAERRDPLAALGQSNFQDDAPRETSLELYAAALTIVNL